MQIPLSRTEYETLEKLAKHHGLTVDQAASLSILYFFEEHDVEMLEQAKKVVTPQVLQAFERMEAK